ncbi:MAG: hypothetical protein INR71_09445 [Terriglobus roseus]|nr:hypothetical protein [Terriglobus roseus]
MVRAAEGLGGEEGVRVLVGDMMSQGFIPRLLQGEGLRGSWIAHQTTGPRALDTLVDGIVETDYLAVMSRILLASPGAFLDAVCQADATSSGWDVEAEMKWLLEEWFSHFENVGDPGRRKLMCLALTRLLESGAPWALAKLQDLMTAWTDVVTELTEGMDDKSVE